jgi:hypothetical protein
MFGFWCSILGLAVSIGWGLSVPAAVAYTATGDRQFPAAVLLPQITPGDEFYLTYNTLPLGGSGVGTPNRVSNFTTTYMKTLTENLGIVLEETYTQIGQRGAGTLSCWQNFDGEIKYLALNVPEHEFLVTLGLDRETGGTGATRVGASPSGATTPRVYFGKGFGDFDIGYLRPLAVRGLVGVQLADAAPRPNLITNGLIVEYSIPYLQSKVHSFDLPDVIRNLTLVTEFSLATPAGKSFGARTTALIAPGFAYAGEGWEFALEALVPATRATGTGIGVTAQLHFALDFLLPNSLGKPLFSSQ